MKLKYMVQKGFRVKKGTFKHKDFRKRTKYFMGLCVDDHYFVYPQKEFIHEDKLDEVNYEWACTSCPCFSVKAFKRRIKKHNIKKGTATLTSRFSYYDVSY